MRNDFKNFWFATYVAWRSGALTPFSDFYIKAASKDFDTFLRKSADVNNRLNNAFLTKYPPRKEEFLVMAYPTNTFGFRNRIAFFVTNQRLWLRDSKSGAYIVFDLIDLAHISVQPVINGLCVAISLKDGTIQKFSKVDGFPSAWVIALISELHNNLNDNNKCSIGFEMLPQESYLLLDLLESFVIGLPAAALFLYSTYDKFGKKCGVIYVIYVISAICLAIGSGSIVKRMKR
jgi:hypothetical protein